MPFEEETNAAHSLSMLSECMQGARHRVYAGHLLVGQTLAPILPELMVFHSGDKHDIHATAKGCIGCVMLQSGLSHLVINFPFM